MNSSFTASAYLVKTERTQAPPKRARKTASFVARTEKKNITKKQFVPPGDGRFFDHFH